MRIEPIKRLAGKLNLPGDKSISHRAAMFAALANGASTLENYSTGQDCASTLGVLRALGVGVQRTGARVTIRSAGRAAFQPPSAPLDCGNSGTTMRLMAGILAGCNFTSELTGDASLSRRPMRRIIAPLADMGAQIAAPDGHAPLIVAGRETLNAITYALPVASAQVKSCVLLAGLSADACTAVIEPTPTRDHTERLLQWFGADVSARYAEIEEMLTAGNEIIVANERTLARVIGVAPQATLAARDVMIPGDISSAAFFIAASALMPASEIVIENVGLNPTRAGIVTALAALGADIRIEELREVCNEPVGALRVRGGMTGASGKPNFLTPSRAGASELGGAKIAQLIDELPLLAVVGSQTEGGLTIRDARELRVKESDRIAATVANLRAMGATVEEFDDGLQVAGNARLRGARLDAHDDHRIAMAFTIAALLADGASEIAGAECVAISFPEFFTLLDELAADGN